MLANASLDIAFHDTYYVVARMGLNNLSSFNYFASDYMLETILFLFCLLFINTSYLCGFKYASSAASQDGAWNILIFVLSLRSKLKLLINLFQLDVSRNNILLKSQNNNSRDPFGSNIQSAENCKGFSETACQIPEKEDSKFWNWFAGVIDGDGNFDIRLDPINNERVLKQIRIKLHNRDIRILKRIQDYLHLGRIRTDKNKPYSIYIVSTKETMLYIINNINGLIRLKVPSFKEACSLYNINYIEANYNIELYDSYFAGLIDTDGSIVFNYAGNRIECNLEFQYNEYTSKLNFDNTILNSKPTIIKRKKSSKSGILRAAKQHARSSSASSASSASKFIAFKFQNVNNMLFIYDYFMHNRLYCDMKFYRVTKIKPFVEIRKYKTYPKYSLEHKIYSNFIIDWIQYENPLWYKIPCVKNYLLYEHK